MVADGGVVRARLILDASPFSQTLTKEIANAEKTLANSNIGNNIQRQMKQAESSVSNFTTKASSGFKNLVNQIESIQNTSKGFGQSFVNSVATPMVQSLQQARNETALFQKQLNTNASTGFINLISEVETYEKEIIQATSLTLKFNGELNSMSLGGPFAGWSNDLKKFENDLGTSYNTLKNQLMGIGKIASGASPLENVWNQVGPYEKIVKDAAGSYAATGRSFVTTNYMMANASKMLGNSFKDSIIGANKAEDAISQMLSSPSKYVPNAISQMNNFNYQSQAGAQNLFKDLDEYNQKFLNINKTLSNLNPLGNYQAEAGFQNLMSNMDSLSANFNGNIQKMSTEAKAGGETIGRSLSSGIKNYFTGLGASDYMASIFGTMVLGSTWNYAQTLAGTKAQLGIKYDPKTAATYYGQEQQYTLKSSTSDQQIQSLLKYILAADDLKANQTYAALNAIDAAATTPDPIQRIERLRNYGQYLEGGADVKKIFKGDVSDKQMDILEAANEKGATARIAAMETVAKQQGSITKFGESLSTITLDSLPKYDKATQDAIRGQASYNTLMAASDTVMRGMSQGMTTLVEFIAPAAQWFNNLGSDTQNLIGQIGFFTGALIVGVSTLKIFGSLMSPLFDGIKAVSKLSSLNLPSWLTGKENIVSSNVNVEGAEVIVGGASTTSTGGVIGGSSGTSKKQSVKLSGARGVASALVKSVIPLSIAVTLLASLDTAGSGGSNADLKTYCEKHPNSAYCKKNKKAIDDGTKSPPPTPPQPVQKPNEGVKFHKPGETVGPDKGKGTGPGGEKFTHTYNSAYVTTTPDIPGLSGIHFPTSIADLQKMIPGIPSLDQLQNPFAIPGLNRGFGGIGSSFSGLGSWFMKSIQGPVGVNNGQGQGGLLDWLLPKPASAASTNGTTGPNGIVPGTETQSVQLNGGMQWPTTQDILNGMGLGNFQFPTFAWPTIQDIENLLGLSSFQLPQFKFPTLQDIEQWLHIPNFPNWHIPGLPDIQRWLHIPGFPNWHIPGLTDIQRWLHIPSFPGWHIPSISTIISAMHIPAFKWPWGPSTGITKSVQSIGSGSNGGGGGVFGPPRGPLTTSLASIMSNRSGVGMGYVNQSMNSNFSGVGGFRPIADYLSNNLSYQFYMGDQKSDAQVWNSKSCNCYDGAQLLVDEASNRFGLGTGIQTGVWDGTNIPHAWSVIGGSNFDMAAKLIRGQWNPPAGPAKNLSEFMQDIGPGLEYVGYAGHGQDPVNSLMYGGNCFDMTLGLMNLSNQLYGTNSEMVWGHWGDQSHVWMRANGRDYDPARKALTGSWNPPPQGPAPSISNGGHYAGSGDIDNSMYFDFRGATFNGDEQETKKIITDTAKQVFREEWKKKMNPKRTTGL